MQPLQFFWERQIPSQRGLQKNSESPHHIYLPSLGLSPPGQIID